MLGWTLQNEKLQILFVMLILPLSMNICQFWVIDYILKQKTPEKFPIRIDDDEEDLYGLVHGLEHNSDDDSRDNDDSTEHHVGQANNRDHHNDRPMRLQPTDSRDSPQEEDDDEEFTELTSAPVHRLQ